MFKLRQPKFRNDCNYHLSNVIYKSCTLLLLPKIKSDTGSGLGFSQIFDSGSGFEETADSGRSRPGTPVSGPPLPETNRQS